MDGSSHGPTPGGSVPHPRPGEVPSLPGQRSADVWAPPPSGGPYVAAPDYLLAGPVQDYDFYAPPPRSTGKRAAMLAGFAVAYVGAWMLVMVAVLAVPWWSVDPSLYPTDAAYDAAMDRAAEPWTPLAFGAGVVLQVVAFALLARKVHYRWFDSFLSLVPFYGYVFMIKILWRCTDIRRFRQPVDPYARARRHNPYYSQAGSC